MEFREVNSSDINDLYLFRNDSLSRKMSINSKYFSLDHHKDWFWRQKKDKFVEIYIYQLSHSDQELKTKLEQATTAINSNLTQEQMNKLDISKVGSIRREMLDPKKNNFENWQISYIINPKLRKLGYGYLMIKEFMKFKPSRYCASVLKQNNASIKTLEKNGFRLNSTRKNIYFYNNFED